MRENSCVCSPVCSGEAFSLILATSDHKRSKIQIYIYNTFTQNSALLRCGSALSHSRVKTEALFFSPCFHTKTINLKLLFVKLFLQQFSASRKWSCSHLPFVGIKCMRFISSEMCMKLR